MDRPEIYCEVARHYNGEILGAEMAVMGALLDQIRS